MIRAEEKNIRKGGENMTDRQFLHHLRELLAVAKACKTLEEFIEKLEEMISSYDR